MEKKPVTMNIERVQIKEMNPAVYNPRIELKPGDDDYENLKKSILRFGYVDPLIWNKRTGNLVGGHQRLKILKEMGVEEVEVSVVNMDLKEERLLNVALNRIHGDWDITKLKQFFFETDAEDWGATGFSKEEVDKLTEGLEGLGDISSFSPAEESITMVLNFEADEYNIVNTWLLDKMAQYRAKSKEGALLEMARVRGG